MLIYKATNILNGKCYIGKTIGTLNKRMKRHINISINGNNENKYYIHHAILKYGVELLKEEGKL